LPSLQGFDGEYLYTTSVAEAIKEVITTLYILSSTCKQSRPSSLS
jgi:hypothetical protein